MKKQIEINRKLEDLVKCDDLIAYDKNGNVFEVFRIITSNIIDTSSGFIKYIFDKSRNLITFILPFNHYDNDIGIEIFASNENIEKSKDILKSVDTVSKIKIEQTREEEGYIQSVTTNEEGNNRMKEFIDSDFLERLRECVCIVGWGVDFFVVAEFVEKLYKLNGSEIQEKTLFPYDLES